ncbi:YqgE/AlgH family protein [Ferruginibacter lapsinanis]|uniref:YqgE/AlgH family protein n=1 Tax=Ferruginibacter lapsinanis TaxID=563172 RepID=UPI001E42820D|nr:YqgE/AlgH family protein [Ferruginibacter lapsinanis]UEG49201.1 YqgE/AlgH family protein [Ferruginibacter lapsinanis]
MNINAGTLLISTPSLDGSIFERSVLFIAEYNDKGAMGFVINKLFPRTLNELEEFKTSQAFPLYEGGPVANESLFFLHQRPGLIDEGIHVIDTIYLGGDFKKAVMHINLKTINENDIKLFIGYCGWDHGQLEEEVQEGSWLLSDASIQTVFVQPVQDLWQQQYQKYNK